MEGQHKAGLSFFDGMKILILKLFPVSVRYLYVNQLDVLSFTKRTIKENLTVRFQETTNCVKGQEIFNFNCCLQNG